MFSNIMTLTQYRHRTSGKKDESTKTKTEGQNEMSKGESNQGYPQHHGEKSLLKFTKQNDQTRLVGAEGRRQGHLSIVERRHLSTE
jgi:hypothetical protein